MRLIIDLQGAQTGSRFRGIGRYTIALAREIIKQAKNDEVILLLNGMLSESIPGLIKNFQDIMPASCFKIWHGPAEVCYSKKNRNWARKAAEVIHQSFIESLKPDCVLYTSVFEGFGDDFVLSFSKEKNYISTCILYDLIPLMNQEKYLGSKEVSMWYYEKLESLQSSDLLLSISKSSKREAVELIEFPCESIVNIYTAADEQFIKLNLNDEEIEKIKFKFGIYRPFAMYSSATDARKNHCRLIEAYSLLPAAIRGNHQLVFAGGMPEEHKLNFIKMASKCGLESDELIFTGRITDREMVLLYNIAKGFVFPSWHEGFGLPALEAMSCGCPTIASSTSSLPEVVGCKESVFDPFDVDSIGDKLLQLLSKETFRNNIKQIQAEHIKTFSWEKSAKKALVAIKNTLKKSSVKGRVRKSSSSDRLLNESIKKLLLIDSKYLESELIEVARSIYKSEISLEKNKIFVDISEIINFDNKTGIQRVTRNILFFLLKKNMSNFEVVAVYAGENSYYIADAYSEETLIIKNKKSDDTELVAKPGDIFLGLDLLHPKIVKNNISFYKELRNFGCKVFFVVYDLIPILLPEFVNDGVTEGHYEWLDVVSENDGVICISQSVANDFKDWLIENKPYAVNKINIDWFHLGADIEKSSPSKGMPEDAPEVLYKLKTRPSFLMVGTLEPRKGYTASLDSFDVLWQQGEDINLVIVGKKGWKVEALAERIKTHQEYNQRLFWLEGISDEYLDKVYNTCNCLIAASYGEGFGLPLIEAGQKKKPILARDIPVFREVAGDYAYYFSDERDPQVLKQVILDWLMLYRNNQHPKSDNMPSLTWKQSSKKLLDIVIN